jgi:hypothetical protein
MNMVLPIDSQQMPTPMTKNGYVLRRFSAGQKTRASLQKALHGRLVSFALRSTAM